MRQHLSSYPKSCRCRARAPLPLSCSSTHGAAPATSVVRMCRATWSSARGASFWMQAVNGPSWRTHSTASSTQGSPKRGTWRQASTGRLHVCFKSSTAPCAPCTGTKGTRHRVAGGWRRAGTPMLPAATWRRQTEGAPIQLQPTPRTQSRAQALLSSSGVCGARSSISCRQSHVASAASASSS